MPKVRFALRRGGFLNQETVAQFSLLFKQIGAACSVIRNYKALIVTLPTTLIHFCRPVSASRSRRVVQMFPGKSQLCAIECAQPVATGYRFSSLSLYPWAAPGLFSPSLWGHLSWG